MGKEHDSVAEDRGGKTQKGMGGFSFTVFKLRMNPLKTNVIITAGMAAGLLCAAYFVPPAASAGEAAQATTSVALKDVLILVSGGLMALAGTMAMDPTPDSFKAYLNYRLEKLRLKGKG